MVAVIPTVPELGQLVEVRRRKWIVSDIEASALRSASPSEDAQHLVSLTSVEDDAYDESLQVLWELEPGARVIAASGLPEPTGFDPPHYQDALLDAVRWGAVTNADIQALQAPFRSGATIEDYQLDPLARAIQMPRANLLLADDVGLGKTIEAGLVVEELLLRHRARTVLVVCPAALQIKWRDEMHEKFGLEFRIVDTALVRELRRSRGLHANPWSHFPRLITSIDWLKRDGPMRSWTDTVQGRPAYPRAYDILIVDEAHNVAPAGGQHYAIDSLRTKAIRRIAPHFEHHLFLTATPHNGYPESFSSLLELLDNQRFQRGVPPSEQQLRAIMIRRLKGDIVDWTGRPRFAPRKIEPIEVDYSSQEREVHNALVRYGALLTSAASDDGRHAIEFVLKLLKKRLFSSPAAFASTLRRHRETITGEARASTRKTPPSLGILQRAIEQADEEYADDEQVEQSLDDAVDTASRLIDRIDDEAKQLLETMSKWADRAERREEAKAKALIEWLSKWLKPDGDWCNERAIVFTEYRATQNWLVDLLQAHGFGGERLATIYGGMDDKAREQIKAAFQADPSVAPVRLLVATDAASEGIDLQNHCRLMVHFEIPWNPNRLEQRNGRIDRHGQKADEVLIHHFVPAGYEEDTARSVDGLEGELEFLYRVARKVDSIRQDLGRVGPVIAAQVEKVMVGAQRALDTAAEERRAEQDRRMLRLERDTKATIARLHDRLVESRDTLHFSPRALENVVGVGLELAGQPPLKEIADPSADGTLFTLPPLGGTWARCAIGLEHPHTGAVRPITFDVDRTEGHDDVVLVHLNHRLAEMCQRLLRSQSWTPPGGRQLHRVSARQVPTALSGDPAVIVHARMVVHGARGHRLHEELIRAGGFIVGGRFRRFSSVAQLDELWERSTPTLPGDAVLAQLQGLWPRVREAIAAAIESRKDDRMQFVGNAIRRRHDRDVTDIQTVLQELRTSILAELKTLDAPNTQLTFWTAPEREQLERNVDQLRRRAAEIPDEIEREVEALGIRYADFAARVFPASVTLLVPEGMG